MEPVVDLVRTFEVSRDDFRSTRTVTADAVELAPGQVRLAIERFALTANNITYAVAGDMLGYWGFFPAEAPWGRLPAMGLATVAESAHPDIATGGRYFGFYPMSNEVVIQAAPRDKAFRDAGGHRAQHAASYTLFGDVAHDPTFRPERTDEHLLLRGLFTTSFLADDYLADNGFLGAERTLVTSASSKTSICLAACLARIARSFQGFLDDAERWLTVEHRTGPDEVEDVYRALLEGEAEPSVGYVVSMRDGMFA